MRQLIAGIVLLAAALTARAQVVPVNTNATVTGAFASYVDKYALQASGYGFFWLDTEKLVAGQVDAITKCDGRPASGFFFLPSLDCNGTSDIVVGASYVTVLSLTGNCGTDVHVCKDCSSVPKGQTCYSPSERFAFSRFIFSIGDFRFVRADTKNPEPAIKQATDLQGRTWQVSTPGFGKHNWVVLSSGGKPVTPAPTAVPPPATPTAVKTAPPSPTPFSGDCPPIASGYPADSPCAKKGSPTPWPTATVTVTSTPSATASPSPVAPSPSPTSAPATAVPATATPKTSAPPSRTPSGYPTASPSASPSPNPCPPILSGYPADSPCAKKQPTRPASTTSIANTPTPSPTTSSTPSGASTTGGSTGLWAGIGALIAGAALAWRDRLKAWALAKRDAIIARFKK